MCLEEDLGVSSTEHQNTDDSNFQLLLVEDNDDHAELFRRVLTRLNLPVTLTRASDGAEALDYLRERRDQQESTTPDMILLDLKLPRMDGHSVLAEIKQDPNLQRLPVVILSTSNAPSDVRRAYEAQANSYLVKPVDPIQYRDMVRDLVVYWSTWNESPSL